MSTDIEPVGALATAALVAAELQGDAGKAPAAHARHDAKCANCGAQLVGAYCHACGQHGHVHRSLLHIGEELLHGILHFDTRSWRTLPLLVARPGLLTRRYIDGQRSRYVSPLALFLFSVFLMFFAYSLVGGGPDNDKVVSVADSKEAQAKLTKAIDEARKAIEQRTGELKAAATPQAKIEAAERLRAADNGLRMATIALTAANAGQSRTKASGEGSISSGIDTAITSSHLDTKHPTLAKVTRHTLENPELAGYKLKSSAYKFAFLLVPISLPFLWLMFFWRRGVTTYDHAIFLLFSLSFMSLWQAFMVLLSRSHYTSWLIAPALFYVPVHIFLQVKETYGVTGWGATWRTFALMFAGFFVFLAYVVMILAISLR